MNGKLNGKRITGLASCVLIGSGSLWTATAGAAAASAGAVAFVSLAGGCVSDRPEERQESRTEGRVEHRQEDRRDWDD